MADSPERRMAKAEREQLAAQLSGFVTSKAVLEAAEIEMRQNRRSLREVITGFSGIAAPLKGRAVYLHFVGGHASNTWGRRIDIPADYYLIEGIGTVDGFQKGEEVDLAYLRPTVVENVDRYGVPLDDLQIATTAEIRRVAASAVK